MDEIHFYCTICGESLSAHPRSGGGFGECPTCLRVVPIPGFPAADGQPTESGPVFSPQILGIEIKFLCDCCGNKIQCDARIQRRTLKCPVCEKPTRVPAWADSPRMTESIRSMRPFAQLSTEECEFLSTPIKDTGSVLTTAPASRQW